jgi:hypothetical protein
MQYAEIFAVASDVCPKHRYALCGQNVQFLIVITVGMCSNHQTLKVLRGENDGRSDGQLIFHLQCNTKDCSFHNGCESVPLTPQLDTLFI